MSELGHVFISYARVDGDEFARRLHDDLEKRDIDAWLDQYDITGDWESELIQSLRSAWAVLVVVTPVAVLSPQVRGEYNDALNRHIPIIPLIVLDTDLPPILTVFEWVDFRTDYDNAIAELQQRLAPLHGEHLNFLQQQLAAFKIAQQDAPNPQRFDSKIQSLQDAIENWENRVDTQRLRIEEGLEANRGKSKAESALRCHVFGPRVVGKPILDMTYYFQNRAWEQRAIGRLLAEPTTRIVTVIGRGGMGKTALASKVLGDLAKNRWPHTEDEIPIDGIVYLSSIQDDISLELLFRRCAEMLRGENQRVLQSVWTSATLKLEEKVERLLRALQDGLYVVLLDNMEDILSDNGEIVDEDLRVFCDMVLTMSHGVRLLITSRIPLVFRREVMRFDNQVPLTEGLPTEDGVAMLRELDPNGRCGLRDAPQAQLEHAVEVVHGVPRALEILAGILDNDPFANLDDVLDRFYEQENVVHDLVEEGYARLSSNARRAMEALAVFGCPVETLAVDYLLEPFVPGLDVPNVVRQLAQSHMATADRANQTIVIHPIDREHTYSQLPEEGQYSRKNLELRAADYYAQLRLPPDNWSTIDHLAPHLLEFEHRLNAEDYDTAINIVEAIDFDYLAPWGYHTRLLSMRQQLIGRASQKTLEAKNLDGIARAYRYLGNFEKAILFHSQALDIARAINDRVLAGIILGSLSSVYWSGGQYDEAIDGFEQAVTIAREDGDRHGECYRLGGLGRTYIALGFYRQGIESLSQALKIARETPKLNPRVEGNRLENIGTAYAAMGMYKPAIDHFEQALAIARETNHRFGESTRLGKLGDIFTDLAEYEKAISLHEEGLIIAKEWDALENAGHHLTGMARVFFAQNSLEPALQKLSTAIEIAKRTRQPKEQQYRNTLLAQICLFQQELDQALAAIKEALKYTTPRGNHFTAVVHGIILNRRGQTESAQTAFRNALSDSDKLLAKTEDYYAAKYTKGLAFAGLAMLTEDTHKQERFLSQASNAYREAIANCGAKGIIEHALGLVNQVDQTGLLDTCRTILTGTV